MRNTQRVIIAVLLMSLAAPAVYAGDDTGASLQTIQDR